MAKSSKSSSKNNTAKILRTVATFLAGLMVLGAAGVFSSWITGWVITGEPNMSKWQQSDSKDEDKPAESKGILLFNQSTNRNDIALLVSETSVADNKSATLTAVLTPENAFYESVTWTSSTEALEISPTEDNPLEATVTLVGTLSETARITCTVVSFNTIIATCSVDYIAVNTTPSISSLKGSSSNVVYQGGYCRFDFGGSYSFALKPYSSSLTTVNAEYAIKSLSIRAYDTGNYSLSAMESALNKLLGVSEKGWAHNSQLNYTCSDGISGNFTLPATPDALIGKPSGVSSADFAVAFYKYLLSLPSGLYPLSLSFECEIKYNGVTYGVVRSISNQASIIFNPESYLVGADGVEIVPGGGIVFI